ncbi:hypothetical protein DRN93_02395 [archaeon]|nr:MAG: hypothetical protein DRN93_02395 [archaeon]
MDAKKIEQAIKLSAVNEEIRGHILVAWKLSELLDLGTNTVYELVSNLRDEFAEIDVLCDEIEKRLNEVISEKDRALIHRTS